VTLLWVVDGAPHGSVLVRDATSAGTRIVDDVDYELPFGPLGRLVDLLWTRREVAGIFAYRSEVIARRFS